VHRPLVQVVSHWATRPRQSPASLQRRSEQPECVLLQQLSATQVCVPTHLALCTPTRGTRSAGARHTPCQRTRVRCGVRSGRRAQRVGLAHPEKTPVSERQSLSPVASASIRKIGRRYTSRLALPGAQRLMGTLAGRDGAQRACTLNRKWPKYGKVSFIRTSMARVLGMPTALGFPHSMLDHRREDDYTNLRCAVHSFEGVAVLSRRKLEGQYQLAPTAKRTDS